MSRRPPCCRILTIPAAPAGPLEAVSPKDSLKRSVSSAVAAAPAAGNTGGDILIADDESMNRRLVAAILTPLGYRLHEAGDGAEAFDMAGSIQPDAILMDLGMPRVDGLEAVRRLKTDPELKHIPVIVVTGNPQEADRIKALETGADDFLNKPVNRLELLARLRNHLALKRYRDRLLRHQADLEETVAERTRALRESHRKISAASLETIHRLTLAAEYRDEDTGDHIQRMSLISVAIARRLRLKETVVANLRYAASMHDIGKIGIPDRILLNPGRLDPAEMAIMRQHTVIGASILEGSGIGFIRLAEVIALTHHERWDGSGYPAGLKGKASPLVGRIVAVADVFDALTTNRPYKAAMSTEHSLGVIAEGRGSQFDPTVVDAFFASQSEIDEIRRCFRSDGVSSLYRLAMGC